MKKMKKIPLFLAAGLAAAFPFAGCGAGPGAAESKMTSYSASEAKSDTASLFTVPQDQMAHIQVVAVAKNKLPRRLRFSGNVTYNAFKTTPVFSPIGGPVHEILVAPGQSVGDGQQPRLFGGAVRVPQGAGRILSCRQDLYAFTGPLLARRHRGSGPPASRIQPLAGAG